MTLREARFFKGLSQWDISLKTGIPQSKISLFERGYLLPREDEREKLAEVLSCEESDLFPPVVEAHNEV